MSNSFKTAACTALRSLAVLVLGVSAFAVSCVREGADNPDRPVRAGEIRIEYSVDGIDGVPEASAVRSALASQSQSPVLAPITRSVDATAEECVLNDVNILFFSQDGSFLNSASIKVVPGRSYFSFHVPDGIGAETSYKTLIVGNIESYLPSGVSDLDTYIGTIGDKRDKTYDTVRSYLAALCAGRLSTGMRLPMWGEVCNPDGSAADFMFADENGYYKFSGHIMFRRVVCRIDLKSNVADKLIISKVKLNNYRTGGFCFHHDVVYGDVTRGVGDSEWVEVPAAVDGGTYQELTSSIYSFANIVPNVSLNDNETTCLMIAGYYQDGVDNTTEAPKTKLTYYRFNFSGDGGHQILRRNHAYTGIINRVSGPGSDNEEDAMDSNIPRINHDVDDVWDDDDTVPVVDDKGNWMLLSRKSVSFLGQAGLKDTVKVRVKDGLTWDADWDTGSSEYQDMAEFTFAKAAGLVALATNTDNDAGRMRQARLRVTATGGTVADPLVAYVDVMQVVESVILTVNGKTGTVEETVSDEGATLKMPVRTGSLSCKWKVAVQAGGADNMVVVTPTAETAGNDGDDLSITVNKNTTGAVRTCTLRVKRLLKNGDEDTETPAVDVLITQEANGILKVDNQVGSINKTVSSIVDTLKLAVLTGSSNCKWQVVPGDGMPQMTKVINPVGSALGLDKDTLRIAILENASLNERKCTLTVKRMLQSGEEDQKTPPVEIHITQLGDRILTVDGKAGTVVFSVGALGDNRLLHSKVVSTGKSGLRWKATKDANSNAMLTMNALEGGNGDPLNVDVNQNPSKTQERTCTLTVRRMFANGNEDEDTPPVYVVYKQDRNNVLRVDNMIADTVQKTISPAGGKLEMKVMAGYEGFKWKAVDASGNMKSSGVTWTESGTSSWNNNMTVTIPANYTKSERKFVLKVMRATDNGENDETTAKPVTVIISQKNDNVLTVGGKTGKVVFSASALGENSGHNYHVVNTGQSGLGWKATADAASSSMLTIKKTEGKNNEKLEVDVIANQSISNSRKCTLTVRRVLPNGNIDENTPAVLAIYEQPANTVLRVDGQTGTIVKNIPATGQTLKMIVMSGLANQQWTVSKDNGISGVTCTPTTGTNSWQNPNLTVEIPANMTSTARTCTLTVKRANNTAQPVYVVLKQAASAVGAIDIVSDDYSWKGGKIVIDGVKQVATSSGDYYNYASEIKFTLTNLKNTSATVTCSFYKGRDAYIGTGSAYSSGSPFDWTEAGLLPSTVTLSGYNVGGNVFYFRAFTTAPGDPDINGTIKIQILNGGSFEIPITITSSNAELGDVIVKKENSTDYILFPDRLVGAPRRFKNGQFVTSKNYTQNLNMVVTGRTEKDRDNVAWCGERYKWSVANASSFISTYWLGATSVDGTNVDNEGKYSPWYKTADAAKWKKAHTTYYSGHMLYSKGRTLLKSAITKKGKTVCCFLPETTYWVWSRVLEPSTSTVKKYYYEYDYANGSKFVGNTSQQNNVYDYETSNQQHGIYVIRELTQKEVDDYYNKYCK